MSKKIDVEDLIRKRPFRFNASGAVDASRAGKCGRCNQPREGQGYYDSVFVRTIYGPAGMPMESQGHNIEVRICKSCHIEKLENELASKRLSIASTISFIDKIKAELEELKNESEA